MRSMRSRSTGKSSSAVTLVMPIRPMRRVRPRASPVAIMALDGMQSHRWAAPPTMSRSITVTSAPRLAATVAHRMPAGPPPMITKRLPATA